VLFTGGLAAAALAGCYWWADVSPSPARARLDEPFVVLGRNALLLFALSALLVKTMIYLKWPAPPDSLAAWVYRTAFVPLGPPKVTSMLYALTNLAVLYVPLHWLHRRRWYWTA
jgi:predicted acyltransferase